MNLGEQYKKAWFDYKDNIDRDTLPGLLNDNFEWRSLTKAFNDKTVESKDDTLETLKGAYTTTTPEVHYSSDEMLIMSVVHEWDEGKMVIMAFVTFKDGKAIKMISAKGEPA
ncbi:hypothetical protein OAQ39_04130 [Alphaproteobacteria bacterium]|nr:hypothetical protein [Alphaproteobacteria bacterium]